MKYLHNILFTGLVVQFLPLNAESVASEDPVSLEAPVLAVLDEELSLIDKEFNEEFSSLESSLLNKELPLFPVTEQPSVPMTPEENAVVLEEPAPAITKDLAQQEEPAFTTSPQEVLEEKEQTIAENNLAAPSDLSTIMTIDFPVMEETTSVQSPSEPVIAELPQETPLATLNVQATAAIGEPTSLNHEAIAVDLKRAFAGSPIIYSMLFAMSVFSVGIWLYSMTNLRSSTRVSSTVVKSIQNKLTTNHFDEALFLCETDHSLFCKMVSTGIRSRRHGLSVMVEAMKAEGKRSSVAFWQKLGMLSDIAIIAPMLGLLGTVLGMFYAFYDLNRSIESISTLFDGLGVSVGTTVAGLVVAILALILHSTAKYRLVRALANVENEAQNLATLIDDRTSIHQG